VKISYGELEVQLTDVQVGFCTMLIKPYEQPFYNYVKMKSQSTLSKCTPLLITLSGSLGSLP